MSTVVDSLMQKAVADSLHRIHVADSLHQVHVADSIHRAYVADSMAVVREQARDYIFGEGSTICEAVAPSINDAVGVESLVTNPIYTILAVAFTLLYLMWLPHIIRGGGVKWAQLGFSKRGNGLDGRDWGAASSQRLGPVVATWSLSITFVSLLAARILAQIWDTQATFGGSSWILGGIITMVAIAMYVWGVLRISGYLTLQSNFVNRLLKIRGQLTIWAVLVISPLFVMSGLTDYIEGIWVVYLSGIVSIALLLIYLRQSFLLFMKQNISILHWFLYLCGVEILPLTFLWAIVTRQILI